MGQTARQHRRITVGPFGHVYLFMRSVRRACEKTLIYPGFACLERAGCGLPDIGRPVRGRGTPRFKIELNSFPKAEGLSPGQPSLICRITRISGKAALNWLASRSS